MSARALAPAFCALLCRPGFAAAGPIQFTLGVSNRATAPGAPQLGLALVPGNAPDQPLAAEGARPGGADVVLYAPWRLPATAPRDVRPDGTARWDGEGGFSVDVLLTDVASGQSAALTLHGHAHLYTTYSAEGGWGGNAFIGFAERREVTLGGNYYTLIGADEFFGGDGGLNVWAGSDAPAYAPEPGALALAGLGLPLVALGRAFRRRRRAERGGHAGTPGNVGFRGREGPKTGAVGGHAVGGGQSPSLWR